MSEKPPFDPVGEAALLSAYVDGELDADDVARIDAHLSALGPQSEATRREIEQLRRLVDVTGALRLKEPPAEEWEVFWQSVYNRRERSVGWVLLTMGAAVCGAWAFWKFITLVWASPGLPWPARGGVVVLAAGLVILLISVIRERVYRRSRSRYKDIIR